MTKEVIIVGFSKPTEQGVIIHLNKPARLKTGTGHYSQFWISWDKIGSALIDGYTERQEVDELNKLRSEYNLSHPQPAEVSAEEAWKKLLKENYPNDFTPEQIRWMGTRFRKYALELLSLSPHPVRHMSDDEIGEQFTKGIMYIPDEIKNRIEGAKWYRSFIQSQQPEAEAKPKMSADELEKQFRPLVYPYIGSGDK